MTKEEKEMFLLGYLYRRAEAAKEKGLFPDLSIKEIITLYLP